MRVQPKQFNISSILNESQSHKHANNQRIAIVRKGKFEYRAFIYNDKVFVVLYKDNFWLDGTVENPTDDIGTLRPIRTQRLKLVAPPRCASVAHVVFQDLENNKTLEKVKLFRYIQKD